VSILWATASWFPSIVPLWAAVMPLAGNARAVAPGLRLALTGGGAMASPMPGLIALE